MTLLFNSIDTLYTEIQSYAAALLFVFWFLSNFKIFAVNIWAYHIFCKMYDLWIFKTKLSNKIKNWIKTVPCYCTEINCYHTEPTFSTFGFCVGVCVFCMCTVSLLLSFLMWFGIKRNFLPVLEVLAATLYIF